VAPISSLLGMGGIWLGAPIFAAIMRELANVDGDSKDVLMMEAGSVSRGSTRCRQGRWSRFAWWECKPWSYSRSVKEPGGDKERLGKSV
jgi:hypothetical protein